MVSGPASRPVAVSFARSSRISSTASGGIAFGIDAGRRERGSKTASPSTR
jgi:hypothetical protein